MNHLICTQIIDIAIAREDEAFVLQQRLSNWYYQVIVPVLQKTFDQFAAADEIIQLDRLEIDLGTIRLEEMDTREFADKLTTRMKEQLVAVVLSPEKVQYRKHPAQMSLARQWMFYMKHGYLPWNAGSTDGEWYRLVLEGFATDSTCIEALRRLICADGKAVRRMVLLNSIEFLTHLVEALTSRKQSSLQHLIEGIQNAWQTFVETQQGVVLTRRIWEAVLRAAAKASSLKVEAIVVPLIHNGLTYAQQACLIERIESQPDFATLVTMLRLPSAMDSETDPGQLKGEELTVHGTTNNVQIPREGIFVRNAGLVLLHPFLNSLFLYLGLVRDRTFVSMQGQQKALALLNFLCTGNAGFEEHELVVAKILCHYPVEDPLDPGIGLTEIEKYECEALLQEVVARWSILKNTSIEALRATFLQRGGKLYPLAGEPHLLVEANVLDVLLDKLPWGIGVVKLPWMTQMLKVEWR